MENILSYYRVEKFEAKIDKWIGYGRLPEEDVKAVLKGYGKNRDWTDKFFSEYIRENGEDLTGIYTRKGTGNMFYVEFDYAIERR